MKTKQLEWKWIATKGERNGKTNGFGFFTKASALAFARRENDRHGSGYVVARVRDVNRPSFF